MKKVLLFGILCTVLCSCNIIKGIVQEPSALKQIDFDLKGAKMIKKMETTYYYDKKVPFVLDNNAMFIPCKINDTTHLMYYDFKMSGMSITNGLLQEVIPYHSELPKCEKKIKLRIKNNLKQQISVKSGVKQYEIASDFFHFKNLVGVVTAVSNDTLIPKYTCENKQNRFTIGKDIFPGWENNIMLLRFSDTTITLLDSVGRYDTTGFTFVQSLFSCRGFEIWLTIDSIEYAFLFDTDSKDFLSLPQYAEHQKCAFIDNNFKCEHFYVQYEKHKKENDTSIITYRKKNYSTILNDVITTNYKKEDYSKVSIVDTLITQQTNTITVGNLNSLSGEIHYTKKINRPTMGMQFISQYDWIIDNYRNKVYAKKIKNTEYRNLYPNYYQVDVFDSSTLQISLLPVDETKYQLFSIIDSVNGEKVNANNICQMRKLLNKKNGFIDNEMVILPPKETNLLKREKIK